MSLRTVAARAVVLLPALGLLCLLLHFAVDVPYWDDWGQADLYKWLADGIRDYYAIFFRQSLEARDAVPRLVWIAVGFTVGWHVKALMLLSWLCALLTFAALLGLLRRGNGEPLLRYRHVALLVGALLFSSAQWQNWMWGFQLMQFIPPCCLALSLWAHAWRSIGLRVAVCATLSLVATFSAPNGMLAWVLAFPLLPAACLEWRAYERRQRIRVLAWTGVYAALAIACIGFFFWDYRQPPVSPLGHVPSIPRDPMLHVKYFLAWIGAPFTNVGEMLGVPARAVGGAIVMGGVVLLLFSYPLLLFWSEWRARPGAAVRACYPWLCLTGFGIATGLATTVARAHWGVESAAAPRYYTHSLWVTTGLVGMVWALWRASGRRRVHGFRALLGCVALLAILSWVWGLGRMQELSEHQRQNLLTLRLMEAAPANPLDKRVQPGVKGFRQRARFAIDHGLLAIEPIGDWLRQKVDAPDGRSGGQFRIVGQSERTLRVEGWAELEGSPADFVILAVRDAADASKVVTGLVTGKPRPSFAGMLERPHSPRSGFGDTFDWPGYVDKDVAMFAIDLRARRARKLDRIASGSTLFSYTFGLHLDTAEIRETQDGSVARKEIQVRVADDTRWALFQAAGSDIVFDRVPVPPGAMLEFGAGIDQLVWDRSGDGVMFELSVVDESSKRTVLFSRWIDPKNNPQDRRWFDRRIDLAAFARQEVAVRFRTTCGPAGDSDYDWSVWSRPQILRRQLVAIAFERDVFRIRNPLAENRLTLQGRYHDDSDPCVTVDARTRLVSSDPTVLEVQNDGRLVVHRAGHAQVIATHGRLEARVRVESAWPPVIPFGAGSPGKGGITPVLSADEGGPRVGDAEFRLRVSHVLGGAEGMLIAAADPASQAITAAARVTPIEGDTHPLTAVGPPGEPGRGVAEFVIKVPRDPALIGTIVYWQGYFRDEAAELGWSVTNGLIVTVR